jgi:hypothetical protein
MIVSVDIWLRGTEHATTRTVEGLSREPAEWTDDDVRFVLEGMLREMAQLKQPGEPPRTIALRGLSWIVNSYDEGGVVIAIEITLGAAIAGPFDIDKTALEAMISRVMAPPLPPPSALVH